MLRKLYTTQEAGILLGLKRRSVANYVRRGILKAERDSEGRYWLADGEITRYQKERRPVGNPPGTLVKWRGGKPTGTLEQRFWAKVRKTEGCWLWIASTQRGGYGKLRIGPRSKGQIRASRYSWELHNGPIPDGLYVCHHCDNPPCVRPDHLFLGLPQENEWDKRQKGRNLVGERNHQAKLTAEKVKEIRARYATGGISQRQLAAEYAVSQGTLGPIVRGESWISVD